MKLKTVFSIALALSAVVIVGMIFYTKETVQKIRFSKNTDSSAELSAYNNSKLHDYAAQRSTTKSLSFISRKPSNAFLETWPLLLRLAIPRPVTVM